MFALKKKKKKRNYRTCLYFEAHKKDCKKVFYLFKPNLYPKDLPCKHTRQQNIYTCTSLQWPNLAKID